MAAFNYDDFGDHAQGGSLAAALNWAGALLSVLLIAGLATWGWKLWVRDVTGVPVVRALEGPMRVAPEDPGGLASAYQGLTVNRIAEDRVDAPPSERVVLAPQPATLDKGDDLPMADLPAAVRPEPVARDREPAVARIEAAAEPEPAPIAPDGDADAAAVALHEADSIDAAPAVPAESAAPALAVESAAPAETPSATDLAVAAALADIGLKPEPATVRVAAAAHVPDVTPRPVLRPVNLQRVSAPAVTPAGDIEPATIPVGTRLVQLGAYGSSDVARAEWDTAQARFGDYLVGKTRVVQEAQTGGRTFFRLRALGFEDLSEARRFCAVLVAEGANCIPVVQE